MNTESIPMEWLVERAESVKKLAKLDPSLALKRCESLLNYLKCKIDKESGLDLTVLSNIDFLPVKKKPPNWPLTWKSKTGNKELGGISEYADNDQLCQMYTSPNNLNLPCLQSLVGSVDFIVHGFKSSQYDFVLKGLGVKCDATLGGVFEQLSLLDGCDIEQMNEKQERELRNICYSIYEFLNSNHNEIEMLCKGFSSKKILFAQNINGNPVLVKPSTMALSRQIRYQSLDCRPVLFYADKNLMKYGDFLRRIGVHEQFSVKCILDTISQEKERLGDGQCDSEDVILVVNLLKLVESLCKNECIELNVDQIKNLIVPDDESFLKSPDDLCFDDDYGRLGKLSFMKFIHPSIDFGLVQMLGIKSKRIKHLKSVAGSMEFGQKEKLITRLKGILQGYPCDSTILHELLQNADDAGATEIHFVFDQRYHSTSGIFSDSWKPLQGPAILVYNDTCFTESDIQGIQDLGQGNKSEDPTKTGQFGLGFNSTYHLTDVPSFLSKGEGTPNGGILCIFDPNCLYAPLATQESPGMKIPDLSCLRDIYPGVYDTYLQKEIPSGKGTWFRFPLRDANMAKSSEICPGKVISNSDMDELFEMFMHDIFEAPLFLSNVRTIKLSRVSKNKIFKKPYYTVTASLSNEDFAKREAFNNHVKTSMARLKEGRISLYGMDEKEVVYKLTMSDCRSRIAQWIIVQKFGISENDSSKLLSQAVKDGNIGLSPRGGVAIPLPSKRQSRKHENRSKDGEIGLSQRGGVAIPLALKRQSRKHEKESKDGEIGISQRGGVATPLPPTMQSRRHKKGGNLVAQKTTKDNKHQSNKVTGAHPPKKMKGIGVSQSDSLILDVNMETEKSSSEINTFGENIDHSIDRIRESNFRAFCFLPTPIKTGLPVHINGHFIIDPSRRYLWKDAESTTHRGEWNKMIKDQIIPAAYITGIEILKKYILNDDEILEYFYDLQAALYTYHLSFPDADKLHDDIWNGLVNTFYKIMKEKELKLFPVKHISARKPNEHNCVGISWVALSQSGHAFPAYFNDLLYQYQAFVEEKYSQMYDTYIDSVERLKRKLEDLETAKNESTELVCILKGIGLKLIDSPEWIFESILKASVNVQKVSPASVVDFLKSTRMVAPDHCKIKQIENQIQHTSFKSIKGVDVVLSYCKKAVRFSENIIGLPLLVTQDGVLRYFSEESTVFVSEFCTLLPESRSLFVNMRLIYLLKALAGNVHCLAKFDLNDFAKLLPQSVNPAIYCREIGIPKEWHPDQDQLPNGEWIKSFWIFLSRWQSSKNATELILTILKHWCLVPGKHNGKDILVSFSQGHRLLNILSFSLESRRGAFRKLQLPDISLSYADSTSFNNFVATELQPKSVLKCLFDYSEYLNTIELENDTLIEVLKYFYDHMSDLCKRQLKAIPLYTSVSGQKTNLKTKGEILILPRDIETSGLDLWVRETDYVLLTKNELLEPFLIHLGASICSSFQFYALHLFPRFESLNKLFHMKHLNYVRDNIIRKLDDETDDDSKRLKQQLRLLRFIPSNTTELLTADAFFSPFNTVCAKLCAPSEFPPSPFNSQKWKNFMEISGMKTEVTEALFIKFAKQIECEGRNRITETLQEQSEELISHMFQRKDLENSGLLEKIKSIRFVIPEDVHPSYKKIFPNQREKSLICFSGSAPYRFECLLWTTCQILPPYADPDLLPYLDNLKRLSIKPQLGIHEIPPVKQLISHVHNICHSLEGMLQIGYQKCQNSTIDCVDRNMIHILMKSIYKYLYESGRIDVIKCGLSQTPFIHIYDSDLFCKAKQVVLEISSEDQIIPYLFKAPVQYGPYFELFQFLGVECRATCRHYADVLASQNLCTQDDKLNAEELSVTRKAIIGFFREAQKDEQFKIISEIEELYLLGEDGILHKASSLIVCNKDVIRKRLNKLEIPFLRRINLKTENIDTDKILAKLPKPIRPIPLTEIVKEELVTVPLHDVINESKDATAIRSFLCSNEFLNTVCHLIMLDNNSSTKKVSTEELAEIRRNIQSIEIIPARVLQTQLRYKGEIVAQSQRNENCYFCADKGEWKFFFKEGKPDIVKLVRSRLAHLILCCAKNLIRDSFKFLSELVGLVPNTSLIGGYLEENDINIDINFQNIEDDWCPRLGSYVPKHEYIFLDNSFVEFRNGEYAAYEVFDPEIDIEQSYFDNEEANDPMYIYVRIVGKSDTESDNPCNPYLQIYIISMGDERIESVSVTRLYKFVRRQRSSTNILIPLANDSENQENQTESEDEIFKEIRQTLIQAWKLEDASRKRVIKRLYLKWHPDKNPGREKLCTKVFQYIQHIIHLLETGKINETSTDDPGRKDSSSSNRRREDWRPWYETFGERMYKRYRRNRTYFQQTFSDESYGWDYEYMPNPQNREAERWLKQAKIDLDVAEGLLKCSCGEQNKSKCYNWICFISHQASEKALKAATYRIDANKVTKTHCLDSAASSVPSESVRQKARKLDSLLTGYNQMRYPDAIAFPRIPAELYDRGTATEAVQLARGIVKKVENLC